MEIPQIDISPLINGMYNTVSYQGIRSFVQISSLPSVKVNFKCYACVYLAIDQNNGKFEGVLGTT